MKALKRVLMSLLGAALGCCLFVGCLSTKIEVEYVVDGEVYRVQDYEMNEKISLPTPPTKEGHTFIGWYTDEALTTPYTEGEITVGLTLYAKFSVSTLYIVVNTDGGETIDPIAVTPGGDYTLPEAEKEGYTFIGYTYVDENLTEQPFPLSGKFPGKNSIRITAKYEINTYGVTFVDSGNTVVEVEHGKKVTAPATGKTGYTFNGWYTSATEQTDATKFDFTTAITDELTLYAKYTANSYTISVNENGGSFANEADKTLTVSYDGTYTLATPTREGYNFAGYTVDGDAFPTSGTYKRVGHVRLVANWTIKKYTVTLKDFDTDAVLSTQENVEHGAFATAPDAEAGYDKTLYKADKTTVMNVKNEAIVDNTVIYVKKSAKTFTITVAENGGSFANEADRTLTVSYDGTYTLATPTREGYNFAGYTVDGDAFPTSGTYKRVGDVRLVANWTIKKYTVTLKDFDTDAVLSTQENVEHGAFATAPDAEAGYDKTLYKADKTTVMNVKTEAIVDNTVIYVKKSAKTFTITVNGVPGAYVNPTAQYMGTYALDTALLNGIVGWEFVGFEKDGEDFPATGTYTWTENITVTAKWNTIYAPIYFYDGATALNALTISNMQEGANLSDITLPAVPSKTGYSNDGKWYTDAACTEEFVKEGTLPTEGLKLYAKYTANTYKITVSNNVDSSKRTVDVVFGEVPQLGVPSKTGYNFVKYTYDNADFDEDATYAYAYNITIEEIWEEVPQYVSFMDGVNELSKVKVLNGFAVTKPADPTKTGYTFAGWYTNKEYTNAYDFNTAVTADIEVFAKWTANTYKITVLNNVDSTERTVDVTFDEVPQLGVPSKTGYKFVKYTYENADFDEDAEYSYAHNITVREVWEELPQYVSFMDGVKELSKVKVLNGFAVTKPADPTKTGYTFAGWYTNKECTNAYDFNTAVTADIEVFAKWTAKTYTVIFSVWDPATKTMKNVEVTATYNQPLTSVVPTPANRSAYELLGYTVNGAAFDVTQNFTSTETIIIVEKWGLKEGEKLFQYAGSDLNYFQERVTYDDPWTFVYLVGETYEFAAGATLQLGAGADAYVSVNSNLLTIKAVGAFTLTVNGEVRDAKSVEYVSTFGLGGTNYDNVWGLDASGEYKRYTLDKQTEDLGDDVWNKRVLVSAGEVMKVGRENFIPEININGNVTSIDKADVVITVSENAAGKYTIANGAITFDASLIGQKVSVTVQPKYAVEDDHIVIYNVLVNNGVNVYTSDELKAAFSNQAITEINILRNIQATLSADQVHTFTVDGWTYTSPVNSKDGNGTGIYQRLAGNVKVNGNYFTVSARGTVPLVDGRDPYSESGPHIESGYAMQTVHFSIFAFGKKGTTCYDALTMENLNLIGNAEMNANQVADYTIDGKQVLVNSGGCIGVQVGSGTLNLDNVTARYGAFGINVYAEDPILKKGSTTEYTHMSVLNAKDCNIANNWTNNIYVWGFGAVTLDSSYVGSTNGAAIHFDTLGSPYGADCVFNMENGTKVENWVVGTEAWFNAYNAGPAVTSIKTEVEKAIAGASQIATGYYYAQGVEKVLNKTVCKGDAVNFVMLMVQRGDEWTTDNNPDPYKSILLNIPTFDSVAFGSAYAQYGQTGAQTIAEAVKVESQYATFGAAAGSIAGLGNLVGMVEIIDK